MKFIILFIFVIGSSLCFSHEGDEEVEVKNAPRFGGRVAEVEEGEHHTGKTPKKKHDHEEKEEHHEEKGHKEKEDHHEEKGHDDEEDHHDEPKYMSELLISDENKIRLYFYNHEMKDISLDQLPQELTVTSTSKRGNEVKKIKLTKSKKYYIGDMPALKRKPFDLKIELKVEGESMHVEFTGMD